MDEKSGPKIRKRHQRSGGKRAAARSRVAPRAAPAAELRERYLQDSQDSQDSQSDAQPDADPGEQIRLQKILAAAGVASRRSSEEYLKSGRVTVNGEPATLGDSADPLRDVVAVDGEPLSAEKPAYWVIHKPVGVLTTLRDPEGRPTVLDLLPASAPRLFPVGRLDRDTSGLVLLTNDGPLAHRLLHPSHGNEREYRVTVRGELERQHCERLEKGIRLEDGITSSARVSALRYDADKDTTVFSLTLREGKKRQIRRSLLALRHPVKRLVRVRMGPLKLGRMPRAAARRLTPAEIRVLREHCEGLTRSPRPPRGAGRKARSYASRAGRR